MLSVQRSFLLEFPLCLCQEGHPPSDHTNIAPATHQGLLQANSVREYCTGIFVCSVLKFLHLICLLIRTAVWRGCCTKASCWRKRTSITLTGRSSTMTSRRPSRFCGVRWTRFHRCRSGFQSVGSTRLIRQPHLIDNEEQRAAFELYGRS